MTTRLPYRLRCALIVCGSAALTLAVLSCIDRLAANWTECSQWMACPAIPVTGAF